MSSKQMNRLILCIEAALIIGALAIGGQAVVGMICYWSIVAVYHLTDFLIGRKDDGDR